jgi:hypothetical protein
VGDVAGNFHLIPFQVERWFSTLTTQYLRRSTHRSTQALEKSIKHYLRSYNENPKPFVWAKSADDIISSIAQFCNRIKQSR